MSNQAEQRSISPGTTYTQTSRWCDARSPQSLLITACGRALLERSIAVFNKLRQAIGEIEHLADPDSV